MPFTSETEIANLALSEIGARRIASIDSDTSAEAVACRTHFDHCRDTLLRRHPFSFANRAVALSASATAPVASVEWDTAWVLPGDLVRLIRVVGQDMDLPEQRFEIHGRYLHTLNLSSLTIVYVTNDVPVNEWDSLFVDAMRFKLAASIAGEIAVSPEAGARALTALEQLALPDAARVDAQEVASGENRTPRRVAARSGLVRARFIDSGLPPYS